MPIVFDTPSREFNRFSETPDLTPKPDPSVSETFDAGFRMENDVAALMEYSEHPFKNQGLKSDFNVKSRAQEYDKANKTNLFQTYPDAFLGVESDDEFLYKVSKITQENQDRDTLSRSGWTGFAASITAGLASPLSFVPLVGGATRARQAAKMASIGFATGVATEGVLQGTQETRSVDESLIGIAASTALMGILGGVFYRVTPEVRAQFEEELTRAANDIDVQGSGGLGADVVARDPGNLVGADVRAVSRVINKTGVTANPITENIDQVSNLNWRSLTAALDDSALKLEGALEGVAPSPGGTVWNRAQSTYGGLLTEGIEATDRAYNKYFFEGASPMLFANTRARIGGAMSAAKMSRPEFNAEISKTIWGGFESQHKEVVEIANELQAKVYGPILDLAKKAKLLPEDIEVVGDKAWLHRIYNDVAIQRRPIEFIEKIANHYSKKLEAQFKTELEKMQTKVKKAKTEIDDVEAPPETVAALRDKFINELAIVKATTPDAVKNLQAAISETRALESRLANNPAALSSEELARVMKMSEAIETRRGAKDLIGYDITKLNQTRLERVRKQLRADAKDMENAGGADLKRAKELQRELQTRIRNLSRSRAVLSERRAQKLDRIEALEDKSIEAFERVARKAQTTWKELQKWSDEKLDAELVKFKNQFTSALATFEKGEEKVVKLQAEGFGPELGAAEDRQLIRQEKLNVIAAKLDNAENLSREEIRNTVNEGLTFLNDEMAEINLRRGKRIAALDREAAKLDPAQVEYKIGQLKKRPAQITREFGDRWAKTAAGMDLENGAANFMDHAREIATVLKDQIVGNYNRLPAIDLMLHKRGAELRRAVDISSLEISDFLETDIDEITKRYVRTMGPDIELNKKFGSMDWETIQQPARDELDQKLRLIDEDPNLSPAQKEKKSQQLNKDFTLYKNNWEASIARIRNIRGLPADPDGVAYRGAKLVRELNVARQMGGVLWASLPDMGQPVMKYGLTRTFRDGFLPLINNLKAFKMNFREAKLANAANDIALHSRAMALSDTLDDMKRGSKFEEGVQWATNKIGLIALFDYWTVGMKAVTANIANVKIMDALATINGAKGIMKEQEAVEYLAMIGIEGPDAALLWKEVMENAGGAKVNGVWWPNTESWENFEATQIYRQALYREVSRTIIQPGLERPLLSDTNELGRMLYQFKSFGMASTPKIMLAGLQQKDAAVLSGSMASMGLGALGYYFWAVSTGGQAYEDMMNADINRWADEAIGRSGLIGGLGEVQRVGQNIPLISDYVSFSGKKSTRRPGDNLMESLLGPSFDFGQGVASVVTGINEPTQATLKEFRKLLPFQNVFYLRQAIDAVEASAGSSLPERRGQ